MAIVTQPKDRDRSARRKAELGQIKPGIIANIDEVGAKAEQRARLDTVHEQQAKRDTELAQRALRQAELTDERERAIVKRFPLPQSEANLPAHEEEPREQPGPEEPVSQTATAQAGRLVQEASQAATREVATLVRRLGVGAFRFLFTTPWGWGIIGTLIIIGVVIFFVIGVGASDPSVAGTSPVQAIDTTNSAELEGLDQAIAGGVLPTKQAQNIIDQVRILRSRLANRPQVLPLLDAIERAAKTIIASAKAPADQFKPVLTEQMEIIRANRARLTAIIGPGSCGNIQPCLDVEGVAQSAPRLCQSASAMMVLLYLNRGIINPLFDESQYVRINANGVKEVKGAGCFASTILNQLAPPDRRGWIGVSWKQLGSKDALLNSLKNSLSAGDPVIMVLTAGGVGPKDHVVTVVGHDSQDEPAKGGTFLINNPYKGGVVVKTKFGFGRRKLTGEQLASYMAGSATTRTDFNEANPFHYSVIMRQRYVR